jgi:branched-chain amino acid transport system substrate-binding protein
MEERFMKKFIALLLCVLMCFALLSGCAGKESDTIKVGIVGCHTGDYAIYGLAVRNGAELYINQLNEAGGINGKKVELVIYDNKADNAEAVTAFTRMVDEGITALIGDVLTGNTIAVRTEAYKVNMPMITASATAAEVTYDAETSTFYSNVFRTCFIDPFQGMKMAEYAANELGAKKAAILYDTGNDYSIGLKDAFTAKCAEMGVEIVNEEGYSSGDVDFRSQLTNIQANEPDVIFAPIYYQDAGLIVTQSRDLGIDATFLGGDGWAGVTGYASAEDLEGSLFCSAYASGSTDAVKAFETAYTAAYGSDTLNMFAATAYDAAMVLCNALTVVETNGSKLKPASDEYKQAVIDAIRNNSGEIAGITSAGGYTFDEYNNPIKDAVIIEVAGGAETFKTLY